MTNGARNRRYDEALGAYWFSRSTDERLSTTVALAVADVVGKDPTALPPLRSVLDPDALDTLFDTGTPARVEFEYRGCLVSVREGTEVLVYPPESTAGERT
ncbi:MAG: HalOD1 output domain-containing protein [Haloferacaceae archaeon]